MILYRSVIGFEKDGNYYCEVDSDHLEDSVLIENILTFYKIKKIPDLDFLSHFEIFTQKQNQIENIINSYHQINIDIDDYDIESLVPKIFIDDLFDYKKALYEEFLDWAKDYDIKNVSNFFKKEFFGKKYSNMNYQILTKNGNENINLIFAENFRFKNEDGLNLFNCPKNERDIIIPQDENSFIFAFDYRQFEFRTYCNLLGLDIFKSENFYEELAEKLSMNIEDSKVKIISYLYGNYYNENFEKIFKKKELISRIDDNLFWHQKYPVFCNSENSGKNLHSIVQSISQYIFMEKLDKILSLIQNKDSKFLFPLHDSLIFSIPDAEQEIVDDIIDLAEDEVYKVKSYIGMNYRDLQEL